MKSFTKPEILLLLRLTAVLGVSAIAGAAVASPFGVRAEFTEPTFTGEDKGDEKVTPTPTPAPTPTPTPKPTPTPPCAGCFNADVEQNTSIIAGGNVESKQDVTIIGEKHEQTIVQNVVEKKTEQKEEDKPVVFFKTDDQETVKAGQILTYRLVVRNPKDRDLTEVKIVDRVPPFLIPLATNPTARADAKNRSIVWENQTISAKSEITFAFRARVEKTAPDGFILQNIADVHGPGIREHAVDQTVVEGVPQVAGAVTEKPQPVPVTAKTGTPLEAFSFLLSLSGTIATSGTLLLRRFV